MIRHCQPALSSFALLLLVLGFAAAPALAGPLPFTTTELVAGNLSATANGTALLAAVAGAGPQTLIKLEPGDYDLGGDQIVLPDFVDIEGSGRDITTIISDLLIAPTPTVIDVAAGINGEVRELTVKAIPSFATPSSGLNIESDEFLLTEVNVEIDSPGLAAGVRIEGASPRLNEVFVRATATSEATGIRIEGAGTAVVTDSLVFLANFGGNTAIGVDIKNTDPVLDGVIAFSLLAAQNIGVRVIGAGFSTTIRNTRATATAPSGSSAVGVEVSGNGDAQIKESTFRASSDSLAAGILLLDATAKATESTFVADDSGFPHPDVYAALLDGASSLDTNQSNYESTEFAVRSSNTSQARFGASQLIGMAGPPAALTCVFSYFGNYTPRNANCN